MNNIYIQKEIDIKSEKDSSNNVKITTKDSDYVLNYFLMSNDLKQYNTFTEFLKLTENLIRTNELYSQYCNSLKYEHGLNRCSLYSNLDPDVSETDIYYGPIFSLRDIITVCIKKRIDDKKPVCSLYIVDDVLELHSKGIVQIIILSKMIIDSLTVYSSKNLEIPFLDIRLAHGDLITFIRKYKKYFNITHLVKIQEYIKQYKNHRESDKIDSLVF